MPAVLEPAAFAAWLNPELEPDEILPLLHPPRPGILAMHPVSVYVTRPQHEGKKCIEPQSR